MSIRLPIGIMLAYVAMGVIASAQETMIHLNFREAPLQQVILFYEQITRTTVTVEDGDYPVTTLQPTNRLSVTEAIILVKTYLSPVNSP